MGQDAPPATTAPADHLILTLPAELSRAIEQRAAADGVDATTAALAALRQSQLTFQALFEGMPDAVVFTDTERRGFLLMTFTAQAATGDWYFVDTVKSSTHTVTLGYTATFSA